MGKELFDMKSIKLERGWSRHLKGEFEKDYMQKLRGFLGQEYDKGKIIYPERDLIFAAFNSTPFDKVKVVIIGQDPYHGAGQAHGLCFSVRENIKIPPSLQNIFKELNRDLNITYPANGNLTGWAKQGVLLLNATLTVEAKSPGGHQNRGWEEFTDKVVDVLNREKKGLIFVLWGSYAQKKGERIDVSKHYILKSSHPSPFSANRGFMGCGHFSKINEILIKRGNQKIDWALFNG